MFLHLSMKTKYQVAEYSFKKDVYIFYINAGS
jgi:hypothetical protein